MSKAKALLIAHSPGWRRLLARFPETLCEPDYIQLIGDIA
jgi:hypothetical protein